jgi:CheY-like chemotaxis protein
MTPANDDGSPIEVLLVEDDPGDVMMTQEALGELASPTGQPSQEHRFSSRLQVVSDGDEALSYLRREGQYAEAARPDLILLDLNLPRRDGREVLAEIKTDDSLRRIPVIVLTTSQADEDIVRSYQLHANAYVTKPVDFDRFISVVRQIDEFFVGVVKLPPRS